MRPGEHGAVYRFDEFRLDGARGTLRGPGAVELALRPKAFALLRYLVERPGRLLGREELLDALWPGLVVTDDSLTQCVGDLRRALGDRAGHVLLTLPRRGYVLTAEVAAESQPPAAEASPPSPAAGLPEGAPTLRLRPLEALGEDPADVRFAAGLEADLETALARMRWFALADGAAKVVCAGPRYVLRGLLRRAGDGAARVTASLLPEGAAAPLWSGGFDAPAGEGPFAQQDRLVAAVVGAVEPALRRAESERVAALPAGRALGEHDADHRASALMQSPTAANCGAAWALLREALARRPGSPTLLSGAAYCRARYISQGHAAAAEPGGPAERERAIGLAEAAAAGASENPLVLMRVAHVFAYLQHREQLARAMAQRAVELMPWSGRVRLEAGWVLLYCDDAEGAAPQFAEAVRLDPIDADSGEALAGLSFAQLTLGRTAEAVESGRRAVALSPDRLTAHRALVAALGRAGLPAAAAVAELLARDPRFNLSDYLRDRLRDPDRPLFTIAKEGMRRAGVPERAPDGLARPPAPNPAGESAPPLAVPIGGDDQGARGA